MLVEWGDVRLLLGADVPNPEWPGIGVATPRLNEHAAMKVPHHGSREAIHEVFGKTVGERFWVVTPYRRSAPPLPRAEDVSRSGEPEGLRRVLEFVSEVRLTSLPFRHDREDDAPCMTTRGQIRDGTHPTRKKDS